VSSDLVKESVRKWQSYWTQTTKGSTTKEYFPEVEDRLKMKLNLTGNFTTIVTGHGNMKAYLNRFQITDEPTCPCGKGDQTVEHIIYECERLTKERDKLKAAIKKTSTWPTSKQELIKRHYKDFAKFINSVSFEGLNVK